MRLGEEEQVGVRHIAEREEWEYTTLEAFVRAAPRRHREGWYVFGTHLRRETGVLMVVWERIDELDASAPDQDEIVKLDAPIR